MRELLIDTLVHIPPAKALEALSSDDADRRIAGANHSIVEIVAHMDFWQRWFCERCEGRDSPMVARATLGWPDVAPGSWETVANQFIEGLERAASLGSDKSRLQQPISPAIEFPPLANYTVRDALVHMAHHNAHHLGQIVTLRQIMGRWPPPSGGWTW